MPKCRSLRRTSTLLGALALLTLPSGGFGAETPEASAWSASQKSAARLISGGGLAQESYRAGIEIKLDPGSLTYWRNPGDAGVPPVISFGGSDNVASATVRYPAPQRFNEAGLEVFGYREGVIFPIEVTPRDKSKPVSLALHLQYAACDKICIPAEAKAQLLLRPETPPSAMKLRIDAATALVPRQSSSAGAPRIAFAAKADKPAWVVSISPPPDAKSDLFAEAPDGWFFETSRDGDHFLLALVQKPSDAKTGEVHVSLTYASQSGAFEFNERLDAGSMKP